MIEIDKTDDAYTLPAREWVKSLQVGMNERQMKVLKPFIQDLIDTEDKGYNTLLPIERLTAAAIAVVDMEELLNDKTNK